MTHTPIVAVRIGYSHDCQLQGCDHAGQKRRQGSVGSVQAIIEIIKKSESMFKHTFGIAISIICLVLVVGCGPVDIVTSVPALPTGTTESILPTMTAEPDLPTATSESVLPTATTEPAPTLAVPRFDEAACAFEIPEGFQPECGYLIVPEDRTQPNGRIIRLHAAIFKSINPDHAPDPVIHLAGGPGASALNNARPILLNGGTDILKQRDYILFDQRGTQYSQPYLYCLQYDEYLWDAHEQNVSLDEYNDGAIPELAACLDDWQKQGINISAYNSAESAADINDLRLVLGYRQVNLYGTSYGTRLALTVMSDHPEGIRSVIIDSVYPPQANLDLEIAINANRSLQEVFSACAADDLCSRNYGDIEAKFYTDIDHLEKAPVIIAAYGPYRNLPYEVFMDGDLFIDMIFGMLYSVGTIPDIPNLINAAFDQSYTEFSGPVGGSIGSPLSTGLFWSTICREEVPFEINVERPPIFDGIPVTLTEHFSEKYSLNVCKHWDIPPADAKENEAVISDIPTLIFSGNYDPITPPIWAELAAETLSNHYFYLFPNLSHGVMRSSSCALKIGLAFLDNPFDAPESSCMNNLETFEFR